MLLNPSPESNHRTGFSLIELLLAIVVVAVLLVLLVVGGGRVREEMRSTQCLSHLRQIGMGLNAYANENRQFYPPTYSAVRTPANLKTWMTAAGPYLGYPADAMGGAPRPRATRVFYCPAMRESDRVDRKVGYFYNAELVGSDIRRQPIGARTFLVVEGRGANSEALSRAAFIANPHGRHPAGLSNFLTADGGVEALLPPDSHDEARWAATQP